MTLRVCGFLTIALWFAAGSTARADIFAFTDIGGLVHYSNVPTDSRYVRVLAEPVEAVEPVGSNAKRIGGAALRQRRALFGALIDSAARAADLQPALLRAVVQVESGFDPTAVSRKGAQGLMQLKPATAQRYGVQHPFDPTDNLRGGARYLKDLLMRYGDRLELALAAYNAGEDAVDRYGKAIPPFAETRAYVPAVLSIYRRLSAQL